MGIKYGRGWGEARISLSRWSVLSREYFPSSFSCFDRLIWRCTNKLRPQQGKFAAQPSCSTICPLCGLCNDWSFAVLGWLGAGKEMKAVYVDESNRSWIECCLETERGFKEQCRSLVPALTNTHACQWQNDWNTHTHIRLTALFLGLPRWAGTRKVEPIWILLKQETVSGSGISWAICKSAPCSRQITTPASHHSVFYRPDALPAAQPTASKHWRHKWLKQC